MLKVVHVKLVIQAAIFFMCLSILLAQAAAIGPARQTPTIMVSPSADGEEAIAALLKSDFPIFEGKNKWINIRAFLDFDEVVKRLKNSDVAEQKSGSTNWRREDIFIKIKGRIETLPNRGSVLVHYPELGLVFSHSVPKPGESFYLQCLAQGGQGYLLTEFAQDPAIQNRKVGYSWWYDNGKLSGLISPNGRRWEWNRQHREFAEGGILPDKQKNGIWIYYWQNGNVKAKGSFREGKRIDTWNYFYPEAEKNANLQFDDQGNLTHLQAWHEDGNLLGELDSLPVPIAPSAKQPKQPINLSKKPTLVCFFTNGNPMYSYYGRTENEQNLTENNEAMKPYLIINWPNGKAALKVYYGQGGNCVRYQFELCDPSGAIFLNAAQLERHGGATTGCPESTVSVIKTNSWTFKYLPDGPVTLGIWNLDGSQGYEQNFHPVITYNLKNGTVDGLMTVNDSSDSIFEQIGANLSAVLNFKDGTLDGKSSVNGVGFDAHNYEYKIGKLLLDEVIPDQ
jgi:antitoxin component YwqK of YwqJK toxin-antitoxin module